MNKNECSSCGGTKCSCKNKDFTKAVIEIDNPEQITLMRKVVVPASMGDDTAFPPVIGKYHNVLLNYEIGNKSYLYSSDGIPTLLNNGVTDYEEAINLPQINGVTLLGDKSSADLKLADAPMVITVADGNTHWSGADTAEDVYDFFLNKGKVNIIFNGGENYAYEIASAAYIPEEEKMMCTLAVATIAAGEPTEFEGNALFGTMTLYTANKAIDVSQIELQPKLYIADFTGLDLNYNELSGVPATNASIGMVKSGDGLEVASDGTLSISDIEQYAHFFDTVADMKAATNFVDGSFAQTLGYRDAKDGGGVLYKIRAKTGADTPDEMLLIALSDNTLIAEAILDNEIRPEMFGAYANGTNDDSTAVQKTLDLENSAKFRTGKVYLCNSPLTITKRKTIDFSFSTIKVGHSGVGLTINMETEDAYSHKRFTPTIENLVIDCGTASKGIYIDYAYKGIINNIYINNFLNIGMEKYRGYELVIDNLYFWASNQNTTSIGLLVSGNDCEFGNIFGINCHTGVKIVGGGNHFKNIHMWLFNDTQGSGMADGDALYQGSAMIDIAGNDRYFVDYAYFDSYQYGIKYSGYGYLNINSALMYCPNLSDLTANYLTYTIYFIYAESTQLDYIWRISISNLDYTLSGGNTVTAKMIPAGYSKKPIRILNSTIPFDIDNLRKDFIGDFTFEYCSNVNIAATPVGNDKLLVHGILQKDNDGDHGWRITPNDSGYVPITTNEIQLNYKDSSQYFSSSPTVYAYNIGANNTAESGYTTANDYYRVEYMLKINYL